MSKHTPGPWEWQNGCSWWRLGTRFGNGDVLQPVVASHDRHPDLSFKNPADKALIAAAPEMLEALRKANETLQTYRDLYNEDWPERDEISLVLVQAAIAKAEGRL